MLVVSPLLALMMDQVAAITALGLTSTLVSDKESTPLAFEQKKNFSSMAVSVTPTMVEEASSPRGSDAILFSCKTAGLAFFSGCSDDEGESIFVTTVQIFSILSSLLPRL